MAHEELRNTQSSLKQSQDTVKKLEKNISEKESEILSVEEALGKTIKELEIRVMHYVIQNKNAFILCSSTVKTSQLSLLIVSSACAEKTSRSLVESGQEVVIPDPSLYQLLIYFCRAASCNVHSNKPLLN